MHVSCQQQSVVSTLLHVEPQAVHRLELGDLGLLAARGGSEEPFPQILKRRHSSEGGAGDSLAVASPRERPLMETRQEVESESAASAPPERVEEHQ